MKTCCACGLDKPLDEYNLRNASRDGRQARCRACMSTYNREYNKNNSQARRQTWRRYRRKQYLQVQYQLTEAAYDEMFVAQQGVCASCRRPGSDPRPNRRPLHVDHDHACCPGPKSCGSCVRALLCKPCNTLLGVAQDDSLVLLAAVEYLRAHEQRAAAA